MLLRSSSTPVLGSLLSSGLESPSNNHNETNTTIRNHLPPTNHNKPPRNLPYVSCNSSPITPSIAEFSNSHEGLRRAQSEGNLEGLANVTCNSNENICGSDHSRKLSGRKKCLETIPSFSFSNVSGRREEEDEAELKEELLERNETIMAMKDGEYSFRNEQMRMVKFCKIRVDGEMRVSGEEMFLAKGLGIDGGGGGGGSSAGGSGGGSSGGEFNPSDAGGDNHGVEEYYKRMVEENPGSPLFLRNYAQFLYQSKKDLQGAEEYYSRAILADPGDGEILSQYAKLLYELHDDQDRASAYFERASQASPENSHVHAAYANFLWETEEGDDDYDVCNLPYDLDSDDQQFRGEALASAHALLPNSVRWDSH